MRRFRRVAIIALFILALAALAIRSSGSLQLAAAMLSYPAEPAQMAVPVEGVRLMDLRSTWNAPRSGGRKHRGADIFAPRGTPVLSATDGVVWKVGEDSLGGRVVTVLGEGRNLYYYAHLDTWAESLSRGDRVRRGQQLGTVGNTGNARRTPPHLHFGIYRVGLFAVRAIDPVPYLRLFVTKGFV
jgi:peptidoglycan LD-endopeptidase LytH